MMNYIYYRWMSRYGVLSWFFTICKVSKTSIKLLNLITSYNDTNYTYAI